MRRVEQDRGWSLFCPSVASRLSERFGEEFDILYESLEEQGLSSQVLPARTVWQSIIASQIETGGPFMIYKDAVNSTLSLSLNIFAVANDFL